MSDIDPAYQVKRISVIGNIFIGNDMQLIWKPTRPFDACDFLITRIYNVFEVHYFLWEGKFSD
jgi:hypothetical protein